jgi:hypothetical protein
MTRKMITGKLDQSKCFVWSGGSLSRSEFRSQASLSV